MPMGVVLREEGGLWAVVDGWVACEVGEIWKGMGDGHSLGQCVAFWSFIW